MKQTFTSRHTSPLLHHEQWKGGQRQDTAARQDGAEKGGYRLPVRRSVRPSVRSCPGPLSVRLSDGPAGSAGPLPTSPPRPARPHRGPAAAGPPRRGPAPPGKPRRRPRGSGRELPASPPSSAGSRGGGRPPPLPSSAARRPRSPPAGPSAAHAGGTRRAGPRPPPFPFPFPLLLPPCTSRRGGGRAGPAGPGQLPLPPAGTYRPQSCEEKAGRAGARRRRLRVPVPRPRAWRGGGGARGRGGGGGRRGRGGEAEGKLAAAASSCSGGASGAFPQPPAGGDSDSPARAPPRRGAAWETRPEDRRAPGRGGSAARPGEARRSQEKGRWKPGRGRVTRGSGGRRGPGRPGRALPRAGVEGRWGGKGSWRGAAGPRVRGCRCPPSVSFRRLYHQLERWVPGRRLKETSIAPTGPGSPVPGEAGASWGRGLRARRRRPQATRVPTEMVAVGLLGPPKPSRSPETSFLPCDYHDRDVLHDPMI